MNRGAGDRLGTVDMSEVCESLLQKIKRSHLGKNTEINKRQVQVIPYIHKLSHSIKKIASRHDVPAVFSAPCKLSKLCSMTNRERLPECTAKHQNRFTDCAEKVIYDIPLSCGRQYIGQTGRCYNERAKEHSWKVRNNAGGFLSEHCKRCGCTPKFKQAKFLSKSKDKTARELVEAFHIKKAGDKCVSKPSLLITDAEVEFLDGYA